MELLGTGSEASRLSDVLFTEAASASIHMAKANLPKSLFVQHWLDLKWDQDFVTCLRTCLMKPEHLDWMDHIWKALDVTTQIVLGR